MEMAAGRFDLILELADREVNVHYKFYQYKESFMLKTNKICCVVALGAAVFILLTPNVSGRYYLNDVELGFSIGDPDNGLIRSTSQSDLASRIARGAGFFLKSYADFLNFVTQLELADLDGIDFSRLQADLNRLIANLESAKQEYTAFKQQADVTPYDPVTLAILSTFDYNAYQEKRQVIQSIFNRVTAFLAKGHIRELCEYAFLLNDDILERAYFVKAQLDSGTLPDTQYMKDLNQAFAQSLLFGQYTATIFGEIK